jgi:hypothetical protein
MRLAWKDGVCTRRIAVTHEVIYPDRAARR